MWQQTFTPEIKNTGGRKPDGEVPMNKACEHRQHGIGSDTFVFKV